MREERKAVTALDADVVGSTALGERLDAEEMRLVVGEAIARMVAAVEALGGTVKDLAGDGILALFGAPVAHEDDAERAVRAGLRIAEEMASYGTEVAAGWGVDGFAVRIGVNTGSVVLGPVGGGSRVEYGATGDPINTAARLQKAAAPGTVLVGESTYHLVETLFDWDGPEQFELKGKQDEVVAYRATGVRAVPGRARGVLGLETPFVGRDEQLRAAREAADAVLGGTGGILFITGEAGIGKSRLSAEVRGLVEAAESPRGAPLWLEGRCVSYGESLPYWPYRDVLREWLGVSLEEPELRLRISLRREVERLFGQRVLEIYPYLGAMLGLTLEAEAASRLTELSPEAVQYRTFEVVGELITRLADERPVVLAIDDLHWADATSLQLTEQLLGITDVAAVLIVIKHRTEPDHPSWRVKTIAAEQYPHRSRELALGALSGDAHRELLVSLFGEGTIPPHLEQQILEGAEGNPFYLEELVGTLAETGVLVREGEGWRFDHEAKIVIPPTVEKVILARIDRLSARDRDVLTAASVLGRRFGLPLLEGVTGADGSLQESLNALQRVDLIREARRWPEPEYRFKHALIQEAAYRTLLAADREELHRKAMRWLEERYAENRDEVLGLLAHHALAGSAEDEAVLYLTRAGDRARLEWALDAAIGHYRALLPLLERRGADREIALVLLKLAIALHTSLRFAEANETYQRAFRYWRPPEPGTPTATLRMSGELRAARLRPARRGLLAGHQPLHAALRPARRGVAGPDDRPLARRALGDLGRRPPLRLPPAGRAALVGRDSADRARLGLRHPAHARPRAARGLGADLLRPRERRGVLPRPQRRRRGDRRAGARRPDRRVQARRARPVLHERRQPSGFRPPSAARDRARRRRLDGSRATGRQRPVPSARARRRAARPRAQRVLHGRPPGQCRPRRDHARDRGRGSRPARARRARPRPCDVHAAHLGPCPQPGSRRGPAHVDRVPRIPPLGPRAGRPRSTARARVRDRPLRARGADAREPRGRDRRNRAARAPGPHAGHRAAVRPGSRPAAPERTPERPASSRSLRRTSGSRSSTSSPRSWREILGLEISVQEWTAENVDEVAPLGRPLELAPIAVLGWLPGYPDPEYCLRLILHSHAKANEGRYAYPPFDLLIDSARHAETGAKRLELYRQADRLAVAEEAAVIPLVYGRSMAFVRPGVEGWWEFAKSSASFADLDVG